ncbi:Basic form of pathogenesis-related protein 1 [Linum grandiflorum]
MSITLLAISLVAGHCLLLIINPLPITAASTISLSSPRDYVEAHNAVRAAVGVGPVTWNATVAAYAQAYAESRVHGNCELQHSGGPYGENIAEGYGDLEGTDAVKMWASEKRNYDYGSNSCVGESCLHYTQIVWRESVRVGCGRAKCDNGWVFVTCNYDPFGNIQGQRPY